MLYIFTFFLVWVTVIYSADNEHTGHHLLIRTQSAPELYPMTNDKINILQNQVTELASRHNEILDMLYEDYKQISQISHNQQAADQKIKNLQKSVTSTQAKQKQLQKNYETQVTLVKLELIAIKKQLDLLKKTEHS